MTAPTSRTGEWARRLSRWPLGQIAGALLGAAAAFLCLAAPPRVLEDAVAATGLADIISAAAPPLGLKARLLAAILCGLAAFVVGWLIVRAFDRSSAKRPARPRYVYDGSEEDVAPQRRLLLTSRVENAEARVPRPIFAGSELGVPLDEVNAFPPEPVQAEPLDLAPATLGEEAEILDLAAYLLPADEPVAAAEAPLPLPVEAPAPAAPAPPVSEKPETIGGLMARFEAGLVRRGLDQGARRNAEPPRPTVASVMVKAPDDMDSALRNALQELHRVAAGRA